MFNKVLRCSVSRVTIGIAVSVTADRLRDRDNAAGVGDNSAEIHDNSAEIVNNSAEIGDDTIGISSGIFLPGTELLQSPFRTEFSMGSRSRRY